MSNLFKVSLFKDSFLNSKLVESRNVFASSDDDSRVKGERFFMLKFKDFSRSPDKFKVEVERLQ